MQITVEDLKAEVESAWCDVQQPDIEILNRLFGKDHADFLSSLKPIQVDIESEHFSTLELAMDFSGPAQAAYMGGYLLKFLESFEIQEKIAFPVEIMLRADVISTLTAPTFLSETVKPNLPHPCWIAIAHVAEFMLSNRDLFVLTEDQSERLQNMAQYITWVTRIEKTNQ